MSFLYHEFLYRPLFNLLVFFYNTLAFSDVGLAIILLTLLVRLIFWPLSQKSIRSQKVLQELQPQIKALQEKYKDNKEEQGRQVMAFYKENKINPLSGCLPILIQLPILIALYRVFLKGFDTASLNLLYNFVANPGHINPISVGWLNLAAPNIFMAILAGLAQFWQAQMIMPKNKLPGAPKTSDEFMAQAISKQTLYFLPVLTVFVSWRLPSGLALYWLVTTIFTVVQQYVIIRAAPSTNK